MLTHIYQRCSEGLGHFEKRGRAGRGRGSLMIGGDIFDGRPTEGTLGSARS